MTTGAVPAAAAPGRGARLAGLAWTLVRTDFKARYHGTFAGFFWALLKPTAMFLVLMSVFSLLFDQDPHYKLNLVIGLFLYDFFSESTKVGLVSLHSRGYLLTKAKFPIWLLVVTSISNPVVTLATFLVSVVTFLAVVGKGPGPGGLALLASYALAYTLIVIAFSLATSALFLRYRDLNQVWEVISQAGFFVAPVVYPLGILPERIHFWLYLWPPTAIMQFARQILVEGTAPTPRANGFLAAEVAIFLVVGVVSYRRLVPRAAEYL